MASQSSFLDRLATHASNLGRLSVSILEHYVEELIGEDAVDILKEPYVDARQFAILTVSLEETQKEIEGVCPEVFECEISDRIELSKENVLNAERLQSAIISAVTTKYPKKNQEELKACAEKFVTKLHEKLALKSKDDIPVIQAVTLTRIFDGVARTNHQLKSIEDLLATFLDKLTTMQMQVLQETITAKPISSDITTKTDLLKRVVKLETLQSVDRLMYLARKFGYPKTHSDLIIFRSELFNWCLNRNYLTDFAKAITELEGGLNNDSFPDALWEFLESITTYNDLSLNDKQSLLAFLKEVLDGLKYPLEIARCQNIITILS